MGTQKIKKYWPLFATSFVAGIILTILGPYGTQQFPVFNRALFWTGLCVAGGLGTGAVNAVLAKRGGLLLPWQRVLLQSLGATAVVWICFFALTFATQGPPQLNFYVLTPFYIWVISIVICGIGELMRTRKVVHENSAVNERSALYDRLKPNLRQSEIYALSAEDHYVRVHTEKGDELVLMRLADAIKETGPLQGLQTHRSWWVAEAGVKKVIKENGKLSIRLRNDALAPVSRGRAKHIRDANWV